MCRCTRVLVVNRGYAAIVLPLNNVDEQRRGGGVVVRATMMGDGADERCGETRRERPHFVLRRQCGSLWECNFHIIYLCWSRLELNYVYNATCVTTLGSVSAAASTCNNLSSCVGGKKKGWKHRKQETGRVIISVLERRGTIGRTSRWRGRR